MTLPTVDGLRFVTVGQDDELAEPLMAELAVEYATRYGGTPVTGGAFRRFDEHTAELKRIWTDSAHRRRGLGRLLLIELEAEIAARGYRRVYLTTGDRQPEAEALYESAGYTRLTDPLPADGEVYPIAFAKELQP